MSTRNLRHKSVPVYDDDDDVQDEIDGKRSYDIQEKLSSSNYKKKFILDLKGTDLTFERIQKLGLNEPIRIKTKEGLGIVVPEDPNFNVSDVRACVGSRRMVDVMDCKTQKALVMSMREFERYFNGSDRKHIYNVISLEFSQSRLENLIKRPVVVDNLDWIDLVWPQHLKKIQTDQTNTLHNMKYPKVQKYCLMSVAGCYTDFHIDFGGTSVWYHILRGGKIFWLIPPTNENLALYERWTRSGNQGDVFFADIVQKCERVELEAGNSLMIPSGWIHAVYTPKDSLVFGGNFLNSFNIPMQLRISELEMRLKVPNRFRFPFFSEVLWYALERYIHTLTGRSFLNDQFKEKNFIEEESKDVAGNGVKDHVHITPFEYKGIQKLVESLSSMFKNDKNCAPEGIIYPEKLIEAGKDLLRLHVDDDKNLAVTGESKVYWPTAARRLSTPAKSVKRPRTDHSSKAKPIAKTEHARFRRVRCKQCVACLSDDCRECVFCRDMRKYGGPGTMKQSCIKRKCQNPLLPQSARPPETTSKNGTATSQSSDDNHLSAKRPKVISKTSSNDSCTISISSDSPLPSVVIPRVSPEDLAKLSTKIKCNQESEQNLLYLDSYKAAWLDIFSYLDAVDLDNCRQVCKEFSEWLKFTPIKPSLCPESHKS